MSRRQARTVAGLIAMILTILAWLYIAVLTVMVWRAALAMDGAL